MTLQQRYILKMSPLFFLHTNYTIFKTNCLAAQCLILLSYRIVLDDNEAKLKLCLTNPSVIVFNTLGTGLLNCLNARSRGLTFRHRASCI